MVQTLGCLHESGDEYLVRLFPAQRDHGATDAIGGGIANRAAKLSLDNGSREDAQIHEATAFEAAAGGRYAHDAAALAQFQGL